jgi:hypothetical protein
MGDSARLCLFCLEKRTNRQKIFCIENLFSCECRVYCHKKCIKQWHRFCGDDLQCPLCRKSLDVHVEVVQVVEVIVIDLVNYQRREFIKNVICLFIYMYSFLYVLIYFTYHQPS